MKWISVSDDDINHLILYAIKLKEDGVGAVEQIKDIDYSFQEIELPEDTKLLTEWIGNDEHQEHIVKILEYITNRNENLIDWYENFMWTPKYKKRLIIPITYENKVYGWAGRTIDINSKNRYTGNSGEKFIFNADLLYTKHKDYVILCEGIFDVIAVNGIAVLGSVISPKQLKFINNSGKKIIVVPDRDKDGPNLVAIAKENGWMISFPDFDKDIKDCSDAANRYGRFATVQMIVDSTMDSDVMIDVKQRFWF